MNNSPLQIAKREMQQSFATRAVWVCLATIGIVLGLSGPFGTEAVIPLIPRLIYWSLTVTAFYFVGTGVGTYVHALLETRGVPLWPAVVASGAAGGSVIFVLLMALNVALFDVSLDCWSCIAILAANVIGIAVIVTVAIVYIKSQLGAAQVGAEAPVVDAILRRLPLEKRGALISMSVSDHYVEVSTSNGQALLLMRLTDAIAETRATRGLQVHRSHWVALDHISAGRRDGAKAILTMSDGRDIPASRTYVSALKEAGVLPG